MTRKLMDAIEKQPPKRAKLDWLHLILDTAIILAAGGFFYWMFTKLGEKL